MSSIHIDKTFIIKLHRRKTKERNNTENNDASGIHKNVGKKALLNLYLFAKHTQNKKRKEHFF